MDKLVLKYNLDEYVFDNFNLTMYQLMPVKKLEALVEGGDYHACFGLFFKYDSGDGVLTNKEKAIKFLKDGYSKGSLVCGVKWIFAKYLYRGNVDLDKAVKETQKLLDKKCGEALALYATFLHFGIGLDSDKDGAKKIFEFCLEKGSTLVPIHYMFTYAKSNKLREFCGEGYTFDAEEEKTVFDIALKYFDVKEYGFQTKRNLAVCYYRGDGAKKDIKKATEIMEKITSELPNNSEMYYFLYKCYRDSGVYTKVAYDATYKALAYASDPKRKEELYGHLAFMQIFGQGVETDPLMVKYYVDEAVKAGGENSMAKCFYGKMYELGIFYKKDIKKAKSIYESYLNKGCLNAYFWLFDMCFDEGNYKKAEELCLELLGKYNLHETILLSAQKLLEKIIKHKCHNCKYIFTPVEKKGLFGKKKICPHCGTRWKNLYENSFSKINDFNEIYKKYLEIIKVEN